MTVTGPDSDTVTLSVSGLPSGITPSWTSNPISLSGGSTTIEFSWTAPEPETSSVTFYVAGNAANGDGSFVGDWIYTQVRTLYPANPVAVETGTWGAIKALFQP